jgi:hypothetical protein
MFELGESTGISDAGRGRDESRRWPLDPPGIRYADAVMSVVRTS